MNTYYEFYKNHTQPFLNNCNKIIKCFRTISSFLLKFFGEKIFVNSVNVFPASLKPINPIQKYQHIIESNACILKIFVFMFLLSINVLISFGICSTPKESK